MNSSDLSSLPIALRREAQRQIAACRRAIAAGKARPVVCEALRKILIDKAKRIG